MIEPILYVEPHPASGLAAAVRALIDRARGSAIEHSVSAAVAHQAAQHRFATLLPSIDSEQPINRNIVVSGLRLEASSRQAISTLAEASIDARLLKGLATGPLDYPKHMVRHTGDVDLLVHPDDFAHACQVLARDTQPLKADLPVDLLVESTFRTTDGLELDLHHRLSRMCRPATDVLFENPVDLSEGRQALDCEGRLVNACIHLLISPPGHRRISSLIDIGIIDDGSLDEDRIGRLCSALEVDGIVRFARWIAATVGLVEATDPPATTRSFKNAAFLRTDRSVAMETVAMLVDLESMSDRLRYLHYQVPRLRQR